MQQLGPRSWSCLTHGGAEWEVARSLGAFPPCQIPHTQTRRLQLARFVPLDAGTADILAGDPNVLVRSTLARNESAPLAVLERLLLDRQLYHADLASNPRTTVPMLRQIFAEAQAPTFQPPVIVSLKLARNRRTPVDILDWLAKSEVGAVRREVARNINASPASLEALASDPMPSVRAAVATHRHTPAHMLGKMLVDGNGEVRSGAIRNRHTPIRALEDLLHTAPGGYARSDILRVLRGRRRREGY